MNDEAYNKEVRAIKRKLSNSRRELVRAVERMAEIDPLPGHSAEAIRRARDVRDEADKAIKAFGG